MKKAIAAAFAAMVSLAASAGDGMKFALVNMAELIRLGPDYPRDTRMMTEKRQAYEEQLLKMQSELEALGEDLARQNESLRAPNPMLNPSVLEDQRKKFADGQKRFATLRQQLLLKTQECENTLRELQSMLSKRAAEKVRESLAKFAKEKGYDAIFDTDTAAWARDGIDVTGEVLAFCGIDAAEARQAAKDAEAEARRRVPAPKAGESAPAAPADSAKRDGK